MSFSATDCARARKSLSAQLDGELPDLEPDRLDAHLLICPACAAWAEQVRDVTRRLRSAAALEEPAERIVLPRLRRGAWRVGSAVAGASAAAVVATMFVAQGQRTSLSSRQPVPQVSGFVGVTGRHFVISRVTRLADGVFTPVSVSTSQVSFDHV